MKTHKTKDTTFFDLPASEQKKIIKEAAKAANKDQRDLIAEYDKYCADLNLASDCR